MMKKYRNIVFKGFKQKDTDKKNATIYGKMIKEIRGEREEDELDVIEDDVIMEEAPTIFFCF